LIWGAVVVAAGRGERFGRPKQLLEINGMPMVGWSIRTFAQMAHMAEIGALVLVTEPEWIEPMKSLVERLAPEFALGVVAGGSTRQASARNGVRALPERCNAVLIHDGARPLVRTEDVAAGMSEVRRNRGAILATPVVDTIKEIDPHTMRVARTHRRETLWAAQTPQFAMRVDLERAHFRAETEGYEATDDASLLERIGVEMVIVPSSPENFKVTHAPDFLRAEVLLRERYDRVLEW